MITFVAIALLLGITYFKNKEVCYWRNRAIQLHDQEKILNGIRALRYASKISTWGIPEFNTPTPSFKHYMQKREQYERELKSVERDITSLEDKWNPYPGTPYEGTVDMFHQEASLIILDLLDSLNFHRASMKQLNDALVALGLQPTQIDSTVERVLVLVSDMLAPEATK